MIGEPNHGEQIGYLRGRLDGYDNRIMSLEQGVLRIDERLENQDNVLQGQNKVMESNKDILLEIKMQIAGFLGMSMMLGMTLTALAAYGGIAAVGHWWPFH